MYDFLNDEFFTDAPLEKEEDRYARLVKQRDLHPVDEKNSRGFCNGSDHVTEYDPGPPLSWDE
jgi:hypothetical protein